MAVHLPEARLPVGVADAGPLPEGLPPGVRLPEARLPVEEAAITEVRMGVRGIRPAESQGQITGRL